MLHEGARTTLSSPRKSITVRAEEEVMGATIPGRPIEEGGSRWIGVRAVSPSEEPLAGVFDLDLERRTWRYVDGRQVKAQEAVEAGHDGLRRRRQRTILVNHSDRDLSAPR